MNGISITDSLTHLWLSLFSVDDLLNEDLRKYLASSKRVRTREIGLALADAQWQRTDRGPRKGTGPVVAINATAVAFRIVFAGRLWKGTANPRSSSCLARSMCSVGSTSVRVVGRLFLFVG